MKSWEREEEIRLELSICFAERDCEKGDCITEEI